METDFVHRTYQTIADHFHTTRYSHWSAVRDFLDSFAPCSYLLDDGTGNGKYASYRTDLLLEGADICEELLMYAQKQPYAGLIQADGVHLPYRSGVFDGAISIAVLHHLATEERRLGFLREIARTLKPYGTALVSVWALEQENPGLYEKWKQIDGTDYFVPYRYHDTTTRPTYRYYHLFPRGELRALLERVPEVSLLQEHYEKSNWFATFRKNA